MKPSKCTKVNKYLIGITTVNVCKYPEPSHFLLAFSDGSRLKLSITEFINHSQWKGVVESI